MIKFTVINVTIVIKTELRYNSFRIEGFMSCSLRKE